MTENKLAGLSLDELKAKVLSGELKVEKYYIELDRRGIPQA